MQAKIARRKAKAQSKEPLSSDEHLVDALKSLRRVLTYTMMQHWGRIAFSQDVQTFALAFREAAQLPQVALFEMVCVKHFRQHDMQKCSATRFADELPALGWALCHGSQSTLLRYMLELYCEGKGEMEYIRADMLEALVEDMYNIPTLDVGFHRVAAGIVQDVVDYCMAVQPVQPSALRSPTAEAELPEPLLVHVPPSNACTERASSVSASPTISDLLQNKQLFKSFGADDDDDDDEVVASCTTSCSCSELGDRVWLHTDSVIRYFNLRRSKLWPLMTFQSQLRSVFFGNKYWRRAMAASAQPSVMDASQSVFELVNALKMLYLPKHSRSVDRLASPASTSSPGKLREMLGKLIRMRRERTRPEEEDNNASRGPFRTIQLLLSFHNAV